MRLFFTLATAISLSFIVEGRELSFKTNTLERLYFELSADKNELPSSSNGQVILGINNNTPWYITVDSTDFVSNVGFMLFDEEVRSCIPPEVADFIERYMLEVSLCQPSRLAEKLKLDRVSFLSNRIPEPSGLFHAKSFSLKMDEGEYSAEWAVGEKDHYMMFFPAAFELILGAGQIEMENGMALDILKESEDYVSSLESDLVPLAYDKSVFRTSPMEIYCIESVSNVCYYRFDSPSDTIIPIFDGDKLDKTVPNILLLDCYDDLDLHLSQSLYGYKTVSYIVKLGQWKNYCARHHLKSYVGIESIEDNRLVKALLIARNESVGYNHILSIVISKEVLDGTENTIDGVLHGFIPTHNILSLF